MMQYDYSKLIGRIIEVYSTRNAFAEAMGFTDRTLYAKLQGESAWNQDEMVHALELLGVSITEMQEYFFAH